MNCKTHQDISLYLILIVRYGKYKNGYSTSITKIYNIRLKYDTNTDILKYLKIFA